MPSLVQYACHHGLHQQGFLATVTADPRDAFWFVMCNIAPMDPACNLLAYMCIASVSWNVM